MLCPWLWVSRTQLLWLLSQTCRWILEFLLCDIFFWGPHDLGNSLALQGLWGCGWSSRSKRAARERLELGHGPDLHHLPIGDHFLSLGSQTRSQGPWLPSRLLQNFSDGIKYHFRTRKCFFVVPSSCLGPYSYTYSETDSCSSCFSKRWKISSPFRSCTFPPQTVFSVVVLQDLHIY